MIDHKTSENCARTWVNRLIFVTVLVALALLLFYPVLRPSSVLFASDANIGEIQSLKESMPSAFLGFVKGFPLLGTSHALPFTWTSLLMWLLPSTFVVSYTYLIDLFLASIFLTAFMRQHKIGWLSCFLGVMVAFWIGTNLTLIYAGHISKYGVLMFGSAALLCLEKMGRSNCWHWPLLAGGALGMMMLEQPDVGLFMGVFLGSYAVYAVIRESGWNWRIVVAKCAACLAIVILFAGGGAWATYMENTRGIDVAEVRSPQERWDFSTQWSVPVDEVIDFIAPGYMGWRTQYPEGPYWGRTGQSADWKETRRGYQNFRLEGVYLGIIPFILASLALLSAFSGARSENIKKSEVLFWTSVLLVSLLLSFGRYFPLYRLFYQLPTVSSIRNPNKFLHIFQIALGLLAAFGLDALLRMPASDKRIGVKSERLMRKFLLSLSGFAVLFLLWGIISVSRRPATIASFVQQGWGAYSTVIVGNIIRSVFQGALLALLGTAFVWVLVRPRCRTAMVRISLTVLLLSVMAIDAFLMSRHYIHRVDVASQVGENAVFTFLKRNLGQQRIYCVDDGSYNPWLSLHFPFQGIPAFNITAMPRMTTDYSVILKTLGNSPLRLWSLSSVRYILAPAQAWAQIKKDPELASVLKPVFGFNASISSHGLAVTQVLSPEISNQLILENKEALPRYSLFGNWRVAGDQQALAIMKSRGFDFHKEVLVAPEFSALLPPLQTDVAGPGAVRVLFSRANKVELEIDTKRPAILLGVTRYDKGWKAWLNGEHVPVLRCNYLCQGVVVPAGKHNLRLQYRSSFLPLYLQGSGFVIVALAFFSALAHALRLKACGGRK